MNQHHLSYPRYRVRGLPEFRGNETSVETVGPKATITSRSVMDRLVKGLRRPHLSDNLYSIPDLEELSKHWPIFDFVASCVRTLPLKETPLHIAPYLDEEELGADDEIGWKILAEAHRQEAEKAELLFLLHTRHNSQEPKLLESPLATALACYLFAGTTWFRSNRKQIEGSVSQSPSASYIALASGAFGDETAQFLPRIAEKPSLVLELARSTYLPKLIGDDWFHQNLQKHPVFYAAWLHQGGGDINTLELLRNAAKRDPFAAAASLGLESHHPDSAQWRKLIWKNHEMIYWASVFWKTANEEIAEFSHGASACTSLAHDPKWYYHFLRDVDGHDLKDKLSLIWPSPWAAELIVDKGLSADVVLDLCGRHELEIENPIDAAVALWAADYTTKEHEE